VERLESDPPGRVVDLAQVEGPRRHQVDLGFDPVGAVADDAERPLAGDEAQPRGRHEVAQAVGEEDVADGGVVGDALEVEAAVAGDRLEVEAEAVAPERAVGGQVVEPVEGRQVGQEHRAVGPPDGLEAPGRPRERDGAEVAGRLARGPVGGRLAGEDLPGDRRRVAEQRRRERREDRAVDEGGRHEEDQGGCEHRRPSGRRDPPQAEPAERRHDDGQREEALGGVAPAVEEREGPDEVEERGALRADARQGEEQPHERRDAEADRPPAAADGRPPGEEDDRQPQVDRRVEGPGERPEAAPDRPVEVADPAGVREGVRADDRQDELEEPERVERPQPGGVGRDGAGRPALGLRQPQEAGQEVHGGDEGAEGGRAADPGVGRGPAARAAPPLPQGHRDRDRQAEEEEDLDSAGQEHEPDREGRQAEPAGAGPPAPVRGEESGQGEARPGRPGEEVRAADVGEDRPRQRRGGRRQAGPPDRRPEDPGQERGPDPGQGRVEREPQLEAQVERDDRPEERRRVGDLGQRVREEGLPPAGRRVAPQAGLAAVAGRDLPVEGVEDSVEVAPGELSLRPEGRRVRGEGQDERHEGRAQPGEPARRGARRLARGPGRHGGILPARPR